MPAAPLNYKW